MSLYLDASALVKRYLEEDGTAAVRKAMHETPFWMASQIAFVETLRAVSPKSESLANRAIKDWTEFHVIEVDHPLCQRAVELAGSHGLRTLDAIHLASAMAISHEDLTFATWDLDLHAAAQAEGFETLPASLS